MCGYDTPFPMALEPLYLPDKYKVYDKIISLVEEYWLYLYWMNETIVHSIFLHADINIININWIRIKIWIDTLNCRMKVKNKNRNRN